MPHDRPPSALHGGDAVDVGVGGVLVPACPQCVPPAQGSIQQLATTAAAAGGGGELPHHPPSPPPLTYPPPLLKDWSKFSSGPLANQKFSLAPLAPISLNQQFSSTPSASLNTQHHPRGGGALGLDPHSSDSCTSAGECECAYMSGDSDSDSDCELCEGLVKRWGANWEG